MDCCIWMPHHCYPCSWPASPVQKGNERNNKVLSMFMTGLTRTKGKWEEQQGVIHVHDRPHPYKREMRGTTRCYPCSWPASPVQKGNERNNNVLSMFMTGLIRTKVKWEEQQVVIHVHDRPHLYKREMRGTTRCYPCSWPASPVQRGNERNNKVLSMFMTGLTSTKMKGEEQQGVIHVHDWPHPYKRGMRGTTSCYPCSWPASPVQRGNERNNKVLSMFMTGLTRTKGKWEEQQGVIHVHDWPHPYKREMRGTTSCYPCSWLASPVQKGNERNNKVLSMFMTGLTSTKMKGEEQQVVIQVHDGPHPYKREMRGTTRCYPCSWPASPVQKGNERNNKLLSMFMTSLTCTKGKLEEQHGVIHVHDRPHQYKDERRGTTRCYPCSWPASPVQKGNERNNELLSMFMTGLTHTKGKWEEQQGVIHVHDRPHPYKREMRGTTSCYPSSWPASPVQKGNERNNKVLSMFMTGVTRTKGKWEEQQVVIHVHDRPHLFKREMRGTTRCYPCSWLASPVEKGNERNNKILSMFMTGLTRTKGKWEEQQVVIHVHDRPHLYKREMRGTTSIQKGNERNNKVLSMFMTGLTCTKGKWEEQQVVIHVHDRPHLFKREMRGTTRCYPCSWLASPVEKGNERNNKVLSMFMTGLTRTKGKWEEQQVVIHVHDRPHPYKREMRGTTRCYPSMFMTGLTRTKGKWEEQQGVIHVHDWPHPYKRKMRGTTSCYPCSWPASPVQKGNERNNKVLSMFMTGLTHTKGKWEEQQVVIHVYDWPHLYKREMRGTTRCYPCSWLASPVQRWNERNNKVLSMFMTGLTRAKGKWEEQHPYKREMRGTTRCYPRSWPASSVQKGNERNNKVLSMFMTGLTRTKGKWEEQQGVIHVHDWPHPYKDEMRGTTRCYPCSWPASPVQKGNERNNIHTKGKWEEQQGVIHVHDRPHLYKREMRGTTRCYPCSWLASPVQKGNERNNKLLSMFMTGLTCTKGKWEEQ